jgi:hypothetical protein
MANNASNSACHYEAELGLHFIGLLLKGSHDARTY